MVRAWLGVWILGVACAPSSGDVSDPDDSDGMEASVGMWDDDPWYAPLREDGTTVERVDVSRYLGTWFEIGTYPILFQQSCAASTATYTEVPEGIGVRNWCALDSPDGRPFEIVGTARPLDDSNARLGVSFFGLGEAPYWVIELDGREGPDPYAWAIVGGPTPSSLWILARTPTVPQPFLDRLLVVLEARGYDLDAISWTEHVDPPPPGAVPEDP